MNFSSSTNDEQNRPDEDEDTPETALKEFQGNCPSVTLEELKTLWPITGFAWDDYSFSDLVDALRIGKQSANLDTDAKNVNNTSDQE